jgi:hypothetical protein
MARNRIRPVEDGAGRDCGDYDSKRDQFLVARHDRIISTRVILGTRRFLRYSSVSRNSGFHRGSHAERLVHAPEWTGGTTTPGIGIALTQSRPSTGPGEKPTGSVPQRTDRRGTAACRLRGLSCHLPEHASAFYPTGTASTSRRWTIEARTRTQPPASVLSHRR